MSKLMIASLFGLILVQPASAVSTIVLEDCTKPPSVPAKIEYLIRTQTTLKDELNRVGPIAEGAKGEIDNAIN